MTPADVFLAAGVFATIITVVVNVIISNYQDDEKEGEDENVD